MPVYSACIRETNVQKLGIPAMSCTGTTSDCRLAEATVPGWEAAKQAPAQACTESSEKLCLTHDVSSRHTLHPRDQRSVRTQEVPDVPK